MTARKKVARAEAKNKEGMTFFENWDLNEAVAAFKEATELSPETAEYYLNLARAYARSGEFDQAMSAIGQYLAVETESAAVERYEKMFSSALDDVETTLIETAPKLKMDLPQVGKAIQMWLEYRITIGERPLRIPKPALWAAALAYAIAKVNFTKLTRQDVAKTFGITDKSLKEKYDELVNTLDLMPADYRYFTGEENPLDKLVEAARLLEEMDAKFRE